MHFPHRDGGQISLPATAPLEIQHLQVCYGNYQGIQFVRAQELRLAAVGLLASPEKSSLTVSASIFRGSRPDQNRRIGRKSDLLPRSRNSGSSRTSPSRKRKSALIQPGRVGKIGENQIEN